MFARTADYFSVVGQCEECRRRPAGRKSVTGRELCADCADRLSSLATGLIAGGGNPGTAIATEGWFRRFRSRRER